MDARCGSCRFWGTPEDAQAGERFRQCQAVIHDDVGYHDASLDAGDYGFDNDDARRREFRDDHKAVVVDGSGYHAALMIREDFGCVLWEHTQ